MHSAMSVQDQNQHPARRVCLGRIAKAHGVRGLVKVRCSGDDPYMLDKHGSLFTSETGEGTITLTMKNSMGKYWLAEVEGVVDRDKAETLNGTELWIERSKLPEIEDEDEFYFEDLIGLPVQTEDGSPAGKIIAVENFGASDLLEIQPITGAPYHLPFTKEKVPKISIADNIVVIVPPQE